MGKFGRPNLAYMKMEKDVEGLIHALRHDDEGIRTDAAIILSELEADVLEPLVRIMEGKYDSNLLFERIRLSGRNGNYEIMSSEEFADKQENERLEPWQH